MRSLGGPLMKRVSPSVRPEISVRPDHARMAAGGRLRTSNGRPEGAMTLFAACRRLLSFDARSNGLAWRPPYLWSGRLQEADVSEL